MLLHHVLTDRAHRAPDDRALHWVSAAQDDRILTYADAVGEMERAAAALAGLGVGRGDRVAIVAPNSLEYVVAMFGLWRLGAVAALVSVAYADQLDYYLADCDPSVLLFGSEARDAVARHHGSAPTLRHRVCLDTAVCLDAAAATNAAADADADGAGSALSWRELVAAATGSHPPADVAQESDVAHLSYTSGTSGPPKGACLAHEPTGRATRAIAQRLRLEPGDVSYGPTALSSSYQLVANLLPGLLRGAEVCIARGWPGPEAGWRDLDRIGATVVAANPPVLTDILAASMASSVAGGRAPRRLRLGLSGGGPVPPTLKAGWRDQLGVTLAESFGQSELGGFFALGGTDPLPDRLLAACGRPLPDKEVRIVDDDDSEVPVGALGEIVLRGGFMAGYWRRPEKTAEVLRGGWLHSGDVGFVDREGYLHMRGRVSERLTVAGRHIYPRDVEEALLEHPAVTAVALIGLPDPELGHRPVACVTLADGAEAAPLSTTALIATVDVRLGYHPPGLDVRVVRQLPMTPTGKISKAQLLEQMLQA